MQQSRGTRHRAQGAVRTALELGALDTDSSLVQASSMGARHAALLGFDGGRLRPMVLAAAWLETPRGAYGLVETGHSLVCDLVTACLAADRLPSDD